MIEIVEHAQPFGKCVIQRFGALDQLMVEVLRAVGECGIERARILLEDGLQGLGAVAEGRIEPLELVVEARLQLIGAATERRGETRRIRFQQALQLIGAPTDGRFQVLHAGGERGLERGEVVARTLDDFGELDLLIAQLVDQCRDLAAEAVEAVINAVRRIDEGMALSGKLLDEAPYLALVLLVGALEQRYLVMHQRLELARASERA